MSQLDFIVSLNDRAVELMVSARYNEAARLLSKCIDQMTENGFIEDDPCTITQGYNGKVVTSASRLFHPVQLSLPAQLEQVSPGNTFDLYPFVFSVSSFCEDVSQAMHRDAITAALQYNFAVFHHQIAMTTGSSHLLQCALKLYQTAVKVLKQWAGERTAFALFVATANMAHIHSHFLDTDRAMHYFGVSSQIISCVDDGFLTDDIMESVCFHSMSARICGSRTAPAA